MLWTSQQHIFPSSVHGIRLTHIDRSEISTIKIENCESALQTKECFFETSDASIGHCSGGTEKLHTNGMGRQWYPIASKRPSFSLLLLQN